MILCTIMHICVYRTPQQHVYIYIYMCVCVCVCVCVCSFTHTHTHTHTHKHTYNTITKEEGIMAYVTLLQIIPGSLFAEKGLIK